MLIFLLFHHLYSNVTCLLDSFRLPRNLLTVRDVSILD